MELVVSNNISQTFGTVPIHCILYAPAITKLTIVLDLGNIHQLLGNGRGRGKPAGSQVGVSGGKGQPSDTWGLTCAIAYQLGRHHKDDQFARHCHNSLHR